MNEFAARILGDLVMAFHVLLFVLNLLGHALTLAVAFGHVPWWRRQLFGRVAHGAFNLIILVEACFGWDCPLTVLEKRLRRHSGQQTYAGSFLEWLFDGIWNWGAAHVRGPVLWILAGFAIQLAVAHLVAWVRFPPRGRDAWNRPTVLPEAEGPSRIPPCVTRETEIMS